MKKTLASLFLLLLWQSYLLSQIDPRIAKNTYPLSSIERYVLPPVDNEALKQEEMNRWAPGIAPRFAIPFTANLTPHNSGTWQELPNGIAVWRIRIFSKTAKSLNLGFSQYNMPKGGSMVLYTSDYHQVMGPFTPADNESHAQLWTPVLEGQEMVVEVALPQQQISNLNLEISSINHDFLGFRTFLSGDCNLDINCGDADGFPLVDEYRDQIRSIGVYSLNGTIECTGFLVNNTAQDCKPLFMTADHCNVSATNAPSMVVYWNYENSTCRQPGSPQSAAPGDGTFDVFNSGAIYRAAYKHEYIPNTLDVGSDFTLVELDDAINEAARPYFAGWDASLVYSVDSIVSIHHPIGQEKRISFDFDSTRISNSIAEFDTSQFFVQVQAWDIGTTEKGSSGAPLFDKNKRVIGQLFGGVASCSNLEGYDLYGRMYKSWEGGGTPETRLRDWLDPLNTGLRVLDGRDCDESILVQATFQAICAPTEAVFTIQAGSGLSENLALSLEGVPDEVNVEFGLSSLPPGQETTLRLQIPASLNGTIRLALMSTSTEISKTDSIFIAVNNSLPTIPQLLTPDNQQRGLSTSPTLSWEEQVNTRFDLELSQRENFSNTDLSIQGLSNGSFQIDEGTLEEEKLYYWRVRAVNACGPSEWSEVFSFRTGILNNCLSLENKDLNRSIGSGAANTVISGLFVEEEGEIDYLILRDLDISHTFIGDIALSLISPGGTEISLIPSNSSCSGKDMLITFSDLADASYTQLANSCLSSSPSKTGNFQPFEPMATFRGEGRAGLWTLKVDDLANGDGGTLNGWTLEFCSFTEVNFAVDFEEGEKCLQDLSDTLSLNVFLGSTFQNEPVSIQAENLPPGAGYLLSPNPSFANMETKLKIFDLTESGVYSITFTASNSLDTLQDEILLELENMLPSVSLQFPQNQSFWQDLQPVITWIPSANTDSTRIEIASDFNFSNIIASTTQEDSSWFPPVLTNGQKYYWRATAFNICGTAESEIWSFGTRDGFLSQEGLRIVPNPSEGHFIIQFPQTSTDNLIVELYSTEAKRIYAGKWLEGVEEIELNFTNLSPGVYFLMIKDEENSWTRKLMVKS